VTNEQLYLAIGIPMLFNATLTGLLVALFNAKL
jgi:flagellar biosynthesis protein FliQ